MKKHRSRAKKTVKAIGFGMLCCTVIYLSLTYEALKTLVKPKGYEYNKNNNVTPFKERR